MTRRQARYICGQGQGQGLAVCHLLRSLADKLEAGQARANMHIEIGKDEVWLVAASLGKSRA